MLALPAPALQAAHDLRTALRRVRRAPALVVAVVLTLALGLGAAATLLTLVRAALLDPLPFADAGRLVHVWETRAGTAGRGVADRSPTSYAMLLEWRARATGFAGLEGYNGENPTVGAADGARMLRGAQVTAGFFRLLGVRMAVGRDFAADEEGPAGGGVVVVSDRLARLTAGAPAAGGSAGHAALHRTLTVNGMPRVIVGVLPPTFQFARLQDADVWTPVAADAQARADRSWRWLEVVGRLRPHVSLRDVRAQLAAATAAAHPDARDGRTAAAGSAGIVPLRDALLGDVKPILLGLLAAVGLLLVAVATNLALLMLVRHAERAPELAMRAALGATRGRVLRQLVAESVALGAVGGVLAIGVGQAGARALVAAVPENVRINMPYLARAGLDARVVAMLLGVGTLLVVAFGLGPALLVTQRWGRAADMRTTATRGHRRLRRGFVAVQVALTVVLLVASGLLVASFGNLVRRNVGFADPAGLATARIALSGARYQAPAAQQQFYEALLARVAALPGVRGAGVVSAVPAGGGGLDLTAVTATDQPPVEPASPQGTPQASLRLVGGAYFRAMGISLHAGRVFGPEDQPETRPVAVVDARLAKRLGGVGAGLGGSVPGGTVLGRRLRLAATGDTAWEVVGVVGDVQQSALDTDSPPAVYLSHLQHAENRLALVVRAGPGAGGLQHQLRDVVRTLDPGVPVYAFDTLDRLLDDSRAVVSRRLPMLLCGVFGAAALALALVALYAIGARDAQARGREFAIRLAVGGSPAAVRRLLLTDALGVAAAGVVVGSVLAVPATRAMQALLYGVGAADGRVYGGVAAGVLASALLAALRPALRAASVAPSVVLRGD